MRDLASVQRIAEVKPIEGADAIEAVRVNGWWVVAKKGEFSVDDLCVYLEIDSWVPHELAPFLSKGKEPREFEGVKGERLLTVKLRGQLSQGLVLSFESAGISGGRRVGDDLTEALGILKWEKPIPAQLQGQMKGNFPAFIPKTDQERIQNRLDVLTSDDLWEVTTKLDGSSMTVYWWEGVFGVCSRNLDLKIDQVGNTFVDTAKSLFDGITLEGLALQGELMGPGIQGNRENLKQHWFFVFDIWHIRDGRYLTSHERRALCNDEGLDHVPVLHDRTPINGRTLEAMLDMADSAPSLNHNVSEGLVFKRLDGKDSFKVISNKFLLGEK